MNFKDSFYKDNQMITPSNELLERISNEMKKEAERLYSQPTVEPVAKKRSLFMWAPKFVAAAACAVLIVGAAIIIPVSLKQNIPTNETTTSTPANDNLRNDDVNFAAGADFTAETAAEAAEDDAIFSDSEMPILGDSLEQERNADGASSEIEFSAEESEEEVDEIAAENEGIAVGAESNFFAATGNEKESDVIVDEPETVAENEVAAVEITEEPVADFAPESESLDEIVVDDSSFDGGVLPDDSDDNDSSFGGDFEFTEDAVDDEEAGNVNTVTSSDFVAVACGCGFNTSYKTIGGFFEQEQLSPAISKIFVGIDNETFYIESTAESAQLLTATIIQNDSVIISQEEHDTLVSDIHDLSEAIVLNGYSEQSKIINTLIVYPDDIMSVSIAEVDGTVINSVTASLRANTYSDAYSIIKNNIEAIDYSNAATPDTVGQLFNSEVDDLIPVSAQSWLANTNISKFDSFDFSLITNIISDYSTAPLIAKENSYNNSNIMFELTDGVIFKLLYADMIEYYTFTVNSENILSVSCLSTSNSYYYQLGDGAFDSIYSSIDNIE